MNGTQSLLQSGQISLPVSVSAVADALGIKVIDYASFTAQYDYTLDEMMHSVSYAGFSLITDGKMVAVVNSRLCFAPRRKWTTAHEIGHLMSGHITARPTIMTREQEREADEFAADLIAPLTVLHFCGVSSALEIEKLCGISRQAAEIRFQELSSLRRKQDELYRLGVRNEHFTPDCVFLKKEEQRELFSRFAPFIGSYILSRSRHDDYEKHLINRSRQPMAINY